MARGGAGQFMVKRMFADDEELGKKDDDHKPGNMSSWTSFWNGPTMRYRSRKRWVSIAGAVFCIWVFFHYMPADILEPINRSATDNPYTTSRFQTKGQRPQYVPDEMPSYGRQSPNVHASKGPPPRPKDGNVKNGLEDIHDHYYDGDIMFYELPPSLHAISKTSGFRRFNHNVLFAASSLKSASVLIPLACEMTKWNANYVHFAFLGRNDLTVDEILEVNGVSRALCKVFWHDARPVHAKYSTDFRAEASVASALDHINSYMHPQAIITDDSLAEDVFFVRQLRLKSVAFEWTVIELPLDKADRLKWLTRLESRSLAEWHKTDVDIVIQAPAESSGSLMRLLKSLTVADYSGLTPPRIIIELPPEVDTITKYFLEAFVWPPANPLQPSLASQLIVRHRLPGQKLSAEEASVRFLESFYPANANNAHVLLIAPNAQMAPMYFQYLKYYLLEYKYSTVGNTFSETLFGISLDLPTTHLNGTKAFTPPGIDAMDAEFNNRAKPASKGTRPPFLWQAPNSNAALYFGDKWVELHSFLQHRLTKSHSTPSPSPRPKLMTESLPAWTEYFLEFMRSRGYGMLYPASSPDSSPLVTVHKELYHPPEEFSKKSPRPADDQNADAPPIPPNNEPFIVSKNPFTAPPTTEHSITTSSHPLDVILPFLGEDPDTGSIPHLMYDGALTSPLTENAIAEVFADSFRKEVGGCKTDAKGRKRKVVPGSARDLFCFGDETDEDFVENPEADREGYAKREREERDAGRWLEVVANAAG